MARWKIASIRMRNCFTCDEQPFGSQSSWRTGGDEWKLAQSVSSAVEQQSASSRGSIAATGRIAQHAVIDNEASEVGWQACVCLRDNNSSGTHGPDA